MKIKELFGDYLLITILAIIAVLMLSVRVVYTLKNKNVPTETLKVIVPSLTPTISAVDFEKNYPLWQILPYKGDGFVVEKYTEPLVLKVTLVKGTQMASIAKIVTWMEENKTDPTTHKIVW